MWGRVIGCWTVNEGADLKPDRSHLGLGRRGRVRALPAWPSLPRASLLKARCLVLGAHRQRGWGGRRMIHHTVWEGR